LPDFPNPQQDPGTERRLLLVFGLTFLVIILSQSLFRKYLPAPPSPTPQNQSQTQTGSVGNPLSTVAAQAPVPLLAGAGTQAGAESDTVLENDFYKITFTNRGAQVKSWILKTFNDDHGQPLELVHGGAGKYGYPLSLWSYDETLRNKLNSALYVASTTSALTPPGQISFEYSDQDVAVRKTFRFDQSYIVGVEAVVTAKGSQVAAFPMWPAGFGDQTTPPAYASTLIDYQYDSDVERLAIKKVSGGNTIKGPLDWAGVVDQYFAAVFIPDDPQSAALVTLHYTLENPQDPKHPYSLLGAAVGNLKGASTGHIYVGPKSLAILEAITVPTIQGAPRDLRALVNFGFWQWIARPLFLWLRWTYQYVHNWGWAIVLQTLIINLALLPLRITGMKSALKMQKIQPQMKAIQEKYKKYGMRDPKRQDMNKEIWELQQREGVNMWGGCLPMVIQMPFLIAYYSMLGAAIDLRQAHWLWIHDLSSPEPYTIRILPILVIIAMLIMQRMTPQAGMDPAQQKMMTVMMPVMFGFLSWNVASGLCLYWLESNVIGIAQQAIMNRTRLGREMRELAEKRARKKDK
jgi:YidC/Oxa1 family membrane protein insertase